MALRKYTDLDAQVEKISQKVVHCLYEVHKNIGPGYLEKIYEDCLCEEFELQGVKYTRQAPLKIIYKGREIPTLYRLDLVVENKIIIELKCVEKILPVHKAQIMSYLKMSDLELGFLMNFNSVLMKEGLRRVVLKRTS